MSKIMPEQQTVKVFEEWTEFLDLKDTDKNIYYYWASLIDIFSFIVFYDIENAQHAVSVSDILCSET